MTARYSKLHTDGNGCSYDADPNDAWSSSTLSMHAMPYYYDTIPKIYMLEDPYIVRPGLCVIINNTNFKKERAIPGGEKDEQVPAQDILYPRI